MFPFPVQTSYCRRDAVSEKTVRKTNSNIFSVIMVQCYYTFVEYSQLKV